MTVQIAQHWFTVTEYDRMIESGVLAEDARVELINGAIVEMTPSGKRHAGRVKRLNALFTHHLDADAVISVQDPVQLNSYSRPEPDLAILVPRADFYTDSDPTPADIRLVVEVSDSSIDYDRNI